MKIEFWIRNPHNTSWISNCEADIIGFGDEGCALKVSSNNLVLESAIELTKKEKKGFRLITPKVSENRFSNIINIIRKVNKAIPKHLLTVNDFGVLDSCNNSDMRFHSISIGRGISRSFEDCPWWEEYLEVEEEGNRELVIQTNMSNKQKLKNFKKLCVKSIETNYLTKQESSYSNIKNNSFGVNIHFSPGVLAFARACQTAKHFQTPVPDCVDKCNNKIDLKFDEIYDFGQYHSACENLKRIDPDLSLIGNMVYSDVNKVLEKEHLKNADSIILHDYQFENVEEANEMIKEIRSYLDA